MTGPAFHCPRCGADVAQSYSPLKGPFHAAMWCFSCLQQQYDEQSELTRQDLVRRSGMDPERIQLDEWLRCQPWVDGEVGHNCAYALLNTDDIPLPDHACDDVLKEAIDRYFHRHHLSTAILHLYGWGPIVGVSGDANVHVFCIVERVVPSGSATLFGIGSRIPGDPVDSERLLPDHIDECIVRTYGNGADQEYKLRSWYDRLFRGNRDVGRPKGTSWGRAELRDSFDAALRHLRRQHMRVTKTSVALQMGISVSTLDRAIGKGAVPQRSEWDSLTL
jgi:hypothetical protein